MDLEDLRLAVYQTFAQSGRAPEPDELAGQVGASRPEVDRGLAELARARHLALAGQ